MVFAPFWSDNGIDFAHFGLESGMVFERTGGVYERIYPTYQESITPERIYSKSERKKNIRIRNGFEEFFVCTLM